MLRLYLVGVVIAHLGACYQPELRDCTVRCAAPTDCTGGQVCRDDGWCALPSVTSCAGGSGAIADAAADTSANACELGCKDGTCVAGVCVIDCSAPQSCTSEVMCAPNLPCRVVCGERSCTKKVQCGMASSCEVQCTGAESCQEEIACNRNRCDVRCIGAGSCAKKTKCKDACACDITCIGAEACPEMAECPEASCQLGNGCSSQLAGCDRC